MFVKKSVCLFVCLFVFFGEGKMHFKKYYFDFLHLRRLEEVSFVSRARFALASLPLDVVDDFVVVADADDDVIAALEEALVASCGKPCCIHSCEAMSANEMRF